MSYEITNIQRLRVYTEPNGSYAVDNSGSMGSFTDVPFVEGSVDVTLNTPMLDPQTNQQRMDGKAKQILGVKDWTMSVQMCLAPTGTAASSGVTAVQSALGEMLKATLGGESLGVGDAVAASSTSAAFSVADNSGLAAGTIAGWVNSSSEIEARPVSSAAFTTSITTRMGFSGVPAASDDIYGSATYYLTEDPNTSLQFALEGAESDDKWLLMGGQLDSMSFEFTLGEIPKITMSFSGPDWDYADGTDTTGDLTGAIGNASFSNFEPIKYTGAYYVQASSTSTAPTSREVSSIGFEPAVQYTSIMGPAGTNTVIRKRRVRNVPVITGTFTEPYQDQAWYDVRDARTHQQILLQVGTEAGKTVALYVSNAQVTNVQKADADQIASQQVSWEAHLDDQTAGNGTTDRAYSAFRIAFI